MANKQDGMVWEGDYVSPSLKFRLCDTQAHGKNMPFPCHAHAIPRERFHGRARHMPRHGPTEVREGKEARTQQAVASHSFHVGIVSSAKGRRYDVMRPGACTSRPPGSVTPANLPTQAATSTTEQLPWPGRASGHMTGGKDANSFVIERKGKKRKRKNREWTIIMPTRRVISRERFVKDSEPVEERTKEKAAPEKSGYKPEEGVKWSMNDGRSFALGSWQQPPSWKRARGRQKLRSLERRIDPGRDKELADSFTHIGGDSGLGDSGGFFCSVYLSNVSTVDLTWEYHRSDRQ
ncbi:hypothetical protein BC827DRAFT_1154928 [Russula dissimulans]|nr:hypothetical protein BC827DRAFT_1154928 [Russula dissimulans]